MKRLLPYYSFMLVLLPAIGVAQNPCLTQPAKALQGFLANFNTTVEVGEFYSDCVKVPGGNPATLAIQSVEGEGTVAEMTIYATLEGPPTVVPIQAGTFTPPIPLPPGDFGIELDLMAVGVIELAYSRPAGASGNFVTDVFTLNIVASAAFPVTWVEELTYRPLGNQIALDWSVTDQVDVSGYTLEADNGSGFASVAEVAVQEAADGAVIDYTTIQDWPATGAYYRVRQDDYAGTFSYSNLIHVPAAQNATQLTVYPNPAAGFVRVVVPERASAVALYQASGQRIGTYTAAQARQGINVEELPRGMYLLRVLDESGATGASQRLVLQH